MRRIQRLVGISLVSVGSIVAPLGAGGVAQASGGSGVIQRGTCTDGSEWKLKAKHDNGRIEVEYEVDSNHVGQTWRVRIRDNGVLVAKTRATTAGRSGSFEVSRSIANRAGSDGLVARAHDLGSGQSCVGRLSI